MSNGGWIAGLVIAGSFIGLMLFLVSREKREIEEVDELSLRKVLEWFSSEKVKNILETNKDFKAVAIKESKIREFIKVSNSEKNSLVAAVFDIEKEKVQKYKVFVFNKLSNDLSDIFGDKDMIILK